MTSLETHLPLISSCVEHLISLSAYINQEVIIVLNGVNEEITRYLESIKAQSFPITILYNDINRGFGFSVNQALDIVSGEYVCVLHNDTKPDAATLAGLYKLLEHYPEIGLIAPQQNCSLATQTVLM